MMLPHSHRTVSLALLLVGTFGIRSVDDQILFHQEGSWAKAAEDPDLKRIGGVVVFNYDKAYEGNPDGPSMVNAEQDWVVFAKHGTTDAQLDKMCTASRLGCGVQG